MKKTTEKMGFLGMTQPVELIAALKKLSDKTRINVSVLARPILMKEFLKKPDKKPRKK